LSAKLTVTNNLFLEPKDGDGRLFGFAGPVPGSWFAPMQRTDDIACNLAANVSSSEVVRWEYRQFWCH